MNRLLGFLGGMAAVALLSWWAGFTPHQILAVGIFAGMILATLLFWSFRLAFAFLAVALLLSTGLLDVPHFIEFSQIDIVMFLVAMMVVVGFLEERRFFEHVMADIFRRLQPNAWQFCLLIMVLGAISAALVDEVTSILFMTAITLHFLASRRVSPAPFFMMLVFATNIGSAATVVGNPVGVMVALQGQLTFSDFLRWAAPIALLSLAAAVLLSLWYFRKPIRDLQARIQQGGTESEEKSENETPAAKPWGSWLIFLGLISGLVLHSPIESALGLRKNVMLLGTALAFAGLVMLLDRARAREIVERRVDWWTLSFFLALFASVGALRYVGVTGQIARLLVQVAGDSQSALLVVLMWTGGIMSALMDNVLGIATLIPVVQDLQTQGIHVFPLWWGLLFGGTFFGNVTMIGSTANIIAVGVLERRRLGLIDFWAWLKPGLMIGVVTLALATFLLLVQLPLMGARP
jgi:Na+/H+ antiporter NhaD/arsenite permease-like protein